MRADCPFQGLSLDDPDSSVGRISQSVAGSDDRYRRRFSVIGIP
jgi:hypothetical protein